MNKKLQNKLTFGLALLLIVFNLSVRAQTITNVSSNSTNVCLKPGSNTIDVSFTATGFTPTTVFQVVLSDETGNLFVFPPNVIGTGTSSPITATIPLTSIPSGSYLLNVGDLATGTTGNNFGPFTISAPLDSFELNISESQDTVCPGSSITFTATASPVLTNLSYSWFINNVLVAGENLSTFTTTSITTNSIVQCQAIATGECLTDSTATSNIINITIGNNLPFNVSATSSVASTCQGNSVTLTSNIIDGNGPYTYSWTYAVGANTPVEFATTSTVTTNTIPAGAVVQLTVISSASCLVDTIDSVAVNITIQAITANPPAIAIVQKEAFCDPVNGKGVFTVSPIVSGAVYNWKVGGVLLPPQPTPTRLELNIGSVTIGQSISCVMTVNASCSANNQSFSNSILVEIQTAPDITITPDFEMEYGAEAKLEIFGDFYSPSIEWLPNTPLYISDPTSSKPNITPPRTTKYNLTVLSLQKCLVTKEVVVTVLPNKNLFIPTAFSPNGDGRNDILYCRSRENQFEPKTYLMEIFDENGTKVFSSKYQNYGWDGNYKNEPCEQGGYIYHVTGAYFNFEPFDFSGKFLLIR